MYYIHQVNYMLFTKLINVHCGGQLTKPCDINTCITLHFLLWPDLTTKPLFIIIINLAPWFLVVNYLLIKYIFYDINIFRNHYKDTVSVRGSKFLEVKENEYHYCELMWLCWNSYLWEIIMQSKGKFSKLSAHIGEVNILKYSRNWHKIITINQSIKGMHVLYICCFHWRFNISIQQQLRSAVKEI